MRVKRIIVPRTLIKRHGVHPEAFGESIAVLVHDMVTDVYTDDRNGFILDDTHTYVFPVLEQTTRRAMMLWLDMEQIEMDKQRALD